MENQPQQQDTPSTGDTGIEQLEDELRAAISEAYAEGYAKAVAERKEGLTKSDVADSSHVQECAYYYTDGLPLPVTHRIVSASNLDPESLMLHFGERGPVEVEVWDDDTEEATHVFSEYPDDGKQSVDITRDLERAGYRLIKVDEGEEEGRIF